MAAKHLTRSQRYPGAVDIEVDWTAEAVNDVDAVQVDPYWTSRVNALAVIGYSPAPERSWSYSPTVTSTATCTV
ncbi:hypothetical protein [Jatrophihabitans lederbergiae]|uniref:Uncharacterized protein n=1 Tax=Jatrophihabitans lederbergiae TaxID=3075547 RepID=A0ABU2JEE0_9ACTN|nr:hypothetical protein [Jatrophihabitans sp. DSM 44399]MDT0263356.1 hypothetical protein [Jatrophihabitans sp. DSM 44399]